MEFVRAGLEDREGLLSLIAEYYELDRHVFDRQRVVAALQPLLTEDDFGVVWKVGTGAAQGYAVVTWGYSLESGGPEALIDEIYVRPRGQGVGAALVDHIIADCRERGFLRIFLETERHNTRVREFYARCGFGSDDSIWMSRDI